MLKTIPILVHALSPLHAGTGQAADVIDLPIARMKATGIPIVPGSSLKGVLREARNAEDHEKTAAVFGPSDDPAAHAGALVVGDVRLLALPVRSFRGTFAWTTSPLLLALARRDLDDDSLPIPEISGQGALVADHETLLYGDKLYLEDLDLSAVLSDEVSAWAAKLAPIVSPGGTPKDDIFTRRFAVVHDDTMAFLWDMATQVDARIRIDEETRTVAPKALWIEESLPAESILIGILAADRSRRNGIAMTPDDVLRFALSGEEVHQLGGKATVGRGRCRIIPMSE